MPTCYKREVIISATPSEIWQLLTQQNFVKQYLPEVKRKLSDITSKAPYTYYQNSDKVLPAYSAAEKVISWDSISHRLQLARKDLKANINSITIDLTAQGDQTKVMLEVIYQPEVNSKLLLTHASIRSLFSHKLDILKQNIESATISTDYLVTCD